jgi:hypothetical protein
VFNFAVALCSKTEAPISGQLVFTFELKNVPGFSNASIQSSSAFTLHHVASTQVLVLTDPWNVFAMESNIPAVTFSVAFLPSVVACSELMFVYSATLTCNSSVLHSINATVSKDCEFTPQFFGTVPFISEDCYISASLPFLNQSVVRSRAFSSTFGSEVSVSIFGSVPQQLQGGCVIASANVSQGYCLIAQLIDKNGFLVRKAGVLGTLAASVEGRAYTLIGTTTAVTDSNGRFCIGATRKHPVCPSILFCASNLLLLFSICLVRIMCLFRDRYPPSRFKFPHPSTRHCCLVLRLRLSPSRL